MVPAAPPSLTVCLLGSFIFVFNDIHWMVVRTCSRWWGLIGTHKTRLQTWCTRQSRDGASYRNKKTRVNLLFDPRPSALFYKPMKCLVSRMLGLLPWKGHQDCVVPSKCWLKFDFDLNFSQSKVDWFIQDSGIWGKSFQENVYSGTWIQGYVP